MTTPRAMHTWIDMTSRSDHGAALARVAALGKRQAALTDRLAVR